MLLVSVDLQLVSQFLRKHTYKNQVQVFPQIVLWIMLQGYKVV